MPKRSKKGKYRPSGIVSKVKFDVLPPQGDPEVTITGFAALGVAGIIGAMLLTSLALPLGMILAAGIVVVFLARLVEVVA